MRPERAKRPRTAADGTVLSAAPPAKRARVADALQTTSKPAASLSPLSSPEEEGEDEGEDEDGDGDDDDDDDDDEDGLPTPPVEPLQPHPTPALASIAESTVERFLPSARLRVLSILAGQLPPPGVNGQWRQDGSECIGLQDQWLHLRATIKGTLGGEGNSALLVGARGSGKTMLLESVLRSVDNEGGGGYHLVQLDGAIQPTDRLSMRELARQLVNKGAIKMPKEGEEGALDLGFGDGEEEEEEELEVPVDAGDGEEEDDERRAVTSAVLSSLANTTSTILTLLSTGANSKKSLPLIVALSSFDLYTSRPRQALLYVLLDAVQAGSYTPGLCVVGMTSRLDTTDLLEKRVRSRFGGRTINVWPEDVWGDVMRRTLLNGLCGEATPEGGEFDGAWQREVEAVCSSKEVLGMLEHPKAISNTVRTLFQTIHPLVASLSPSQPSLSAAFAPQHHTLSRLSSYSVLSDVTVPEFALLVASKQLLNRDREVFNFEMCFDELKRFVARIEMDRIGAGGGAATASTPNRNGDSNTTPSKRRAGMASTGGGMGWQGLTDRRRVMMAFRSLLALELFQPEASLSTLSMAAPGLSATAATTQRGAQAVRSEYLRVKCTIFAQDIIRAAKAKDRKESLGTHLVQWATSQG